MNELVWYSRLAVLVGALILLVQSIAGRAVGVMTVLGIALLCGGLIVFLVSLALSEGDLSHLLVWEPSDGSSLPPADGEQQLRQRVLEPPAPATTPPQRAPERSASEPAPRAIPQDPASEPPVRREPAPAQQSRVAVGTPNRILASNVLEGREEVGMICPRCNKPLEIGQVAATCAVCGAPHHAACWIEHHFRCSTAGCSGHGSLEAPDED